MLTRIARLFVALAGTVLVWSVPSAALAGPGHDHGEAVPLAAGAPAQPRLEATSELFELVAVLAGKSLTLYLDRYTDNAPVDGAQIELEIGGAKLTAGRHAEGEYVATLPEALKDGVTPVTFVVTVGNESDLLAGSFDLHKTASAPAAPGAPRTMTDALWGGGLLALAAAVALFARRLTRRRVTA